MNQVRFGILSTAKIGRVKVIPAMQKAKNCEVVAICSRKQASAQQVADALGIARAHGSYEALLADPDIDAIYNPLPNHLHVPWTLKALDAGKHVLCEKPVAINADEAQDLVQAASARPGIKVMEAFMYRFHLQWRQVKTWIDAGEIGALRAVHTFFSYTNTDPDNIRNQVDLAGGALMDIGCYGVSVPRFLFGSEPVQANATLQRDPDFGTDILTSGMLTFNDGIATVTCSTQANGFQQVTILGTKGSIRVPVPFNPDPAKPAQLFLQKDGEVKKFEMPVCNQFTLQTEAFCQAILDDSPVPTPLSDAVANMRAIDALFRAAKSGQSQPV